MGRNLWVGPVHDVNPSLPTSDGYGTWTSNFRNFVEHSVELRLAHRHIILPRLHTVFLTERIRGDLDLWGG